MRLRFVILCAALAASSGCATNPFRPYTQTDPVDASYARQVDPGRFLVVVVAADAAHATRMEAVLVEALAAGGGGSFSMVTEPGLEDHAFGPGGPYAERPVRVARYEAQLRAVGLDPKEPIDLVWRGGPEPRTVRANGDTVKLTVRGSGEFQLVIEGGDLQCRGTDVVRTRDGGRGFRERPFELRSGAKPIAVEVLSDQVTTAAPAFFYEVTGFGGDVKALLARLLEKQHHDAQGVTSYRMVRTTVWVEEEASVGAPPGK